MWGIQYKRRILSVVDVGEPYQARNRYCIDIVTEAGERVTAEYTAAFQADQAYGEFRQFAVRGGITKAGKKLFVWPVEWQSNELRDVELQEFARLTGGWERDKDV